MRTAVAGLMSLAMGFTAADAAPCGGDFRAFVNGVIDEAVERGHPPSLASRFFSVAAHNPDVIRRDRAQGIFKRTFVDFSTLVMSEYRINYGANFYRDHKEYFDRAQERYGVSPGVLLSFLALETDFGQVQGDFNTLNALMTLAHDCRRPELFRPHLFAALSLYENGDFDPVATLGAWAGEIGMIQMLPEDILRYGVDGDGDGHVRLKESIGDAILTGGQVLQELGWRPNQPWLVEVEVPADFEWYLTGLKTKLPVSQWQLLGVRTRLGEYENLEGMASLILPQGRFGPAFFALPNYDVYLEWNRSFVYATTSAFFANLFNGEPLYEANNPEPALTDDQMKLLQRQLAALGHDIGEVDGILGALTREAVRAEQRRLGLPVDAWPTLALLNRL